MVFSLNSLKSYLQSKQGTLLCVGPMSKLCIDVAVEISRQHNIPLGLIASRRQIDGSQWGGGYVQNFTTEAFCEYVRHKNNPNVFIARDHGGPWQSPYEVNQQLDEASAMASAKQSFELDIVSGVDVLHIDPSIPIKGETLTHEKILDRLLELYGHCDEFAKQQGKSIAFELGTEEQDGYGQDLDKFDYFLHTVRQFCAKHHLTPPLFVVAQTGTKVMEMQNIGAFGQFSNASLPIEQLQKTLAICKKYEVYLKEHNTDYLSNEALALRPILGIHASNVAPEFGVAETRGWIYLMQVFGLTHELTRFVALAVASKKWEKWLLPQSCATDIERAMICGHYLGAHPEVRLLKERVTHALALQGVDVTQWLRQLIKESMMRYVRLFKRRE